MQATINFFKRPEIKSILILFVATRIILSLIGFSSRMMLEPFKANANHFQYSQNKILAAWGVWDTGYYLDIAKNGYSANLKKGALVENQANYAFFPLYPFLIKIASLAVGNFYLAGLLVSNLCLLLAAFVFYKLAEIDYGADFARGSIKYLFLFPAAFIFSGVFSEALFLLLFLSVFYFARREKWFWAGIFGLFLALSRPLGILVLLPAVYEYFQSRDFKIKKIDYKILYFLFWPAGLGAFLLYTRHLTGSFSSYLGAQSLGWGHVFSNPLSIIFQGISSQDVFRFLSSLIFIVLILVLFFKIKNIRGSYFLAAILLAFFPLTAGLVSLNSLLRYILPIFPLYLALALWPKNKTSEEILIVILALLQGFLMVFWTNGMHLIV